jgi:endogenous inhibitor of DNA gyrase (YacG/DUF329 family)
MESAPPCPICHESVPWEGNRFRPFCSERCRLIDLGAWVSERYRVPGDPVDPDPDAPERSDGEKPE